MLRLDIDVDEIVALRASLTVTGTRPNILLASDIGGLLTVMQLGARDFSRRQLKPKKKFGPIPDGRLETLHDRFFESWSDHAYPFGAAILHGIRLGEAEPLTHDDGYIVEMHDGPARQRAFGNLTMLAVYSHDALLLRIVWIGAVKDLPQVRRRLRRTLDRPGGLFGLLNGWEPGWAHSDD